MPTVMCMAVQSRENMSMVPAGLQAAHRQVSTATAEAAIIPGMAGIIPNTAEATTNLSKMNA